MQIKKEKTSPGRALVPTKSRNLENTNLRKLKASPKTDNEGTITGKELQKKRKMIPEGHFPLKEGGFLADFKTKRDKIPGSRQSHKKNWRDP